MTKLPRISVVTPTYRPFDYWSRQAGWLATQKLDHAQMEWVIVDDHWWEHQTRVAWLARQHDFVITHIPPRKGVQENFAAGAAFNDGVACSQGELVYLMADYMEPMPDTLGRHLELLDVYGERCFFSGAVLPDRRGHEKQVSPWEGEVYDRIKARGIFWGARNDSVPKSAMVAVNGFEEQMDGYRGATDADLAHRLMNYGCRYIIDLKTETGAGMHGHDRSKSCLGEQERNPLFAAIGSRVAAGEYRAVKGLAG